MKARRGHPHQRIAADTELDGSDPGRDTFERWKPIATDTVLGNDRVEARGEPVKQSAFGEPGKLRARMGVDRDVPWA